MSDPVDKPRIEIIPPVKVPRAGQAASDDATYLAQSPGRGRGARRGLKYMLSLIPGVTTLVGLWFYLLDDECPTTHKFLILLALFYLVWPLDIVPERFFAALGLVDDIAVLFMLVRFLGSETLRPYRREARRWLRGLPPENPEIVP